jgi:hypothetical protein
MMGQYQQQLTPQQQQMMQQQQQQGYDQRQMHDAWLFSRMMCKELSRYE